MTDPPERRDVVVKAGAAGAKVSAPTPGVAVQTRPMLHWADIAVGQERLAHTARRELTLAARREAATPTGRGLELSLELRPSMMAITSAAHALDSLYGEVRDLALPSETATLWRESPRTGPPRSRKVNEVLKQGFTIGRADRFEGRLDTLFQLRDQAVHPETGFNPPTPHPLGVGAAREYVVYRCEEASMAVDLLIEILDLCAHQPKPALEAWAKNLARSVDRLRAKRA